MRVILEVANGPQAGQRIRLRDGLVARFGQTEWADFSFPEDSAMGEFHFLLDCRGSQCVLHAMEHSETLVNGTPVRDQILSPGDRVRAGGTELLVHIDGMLQASGEQRPQRPRDAVAAAAAGMTVVEICQRLELGGEAPQLAADCARPADLICRLGEQADYHQALRVRAFTLGRHPAVSWGCQVVAEVFSDQLEVTQAEAYQAAVDWLQSPDEEHCRVAEAAALKAGYEGPGGWLAAAAFWSGDNIAPLSSPQPVAPNDTLTSRAVAGALTTTLYHQPPTAIADRFAHFLALADPIESGEPIASET